MLYPIVNQELERFSQCVLFAIDLGRVRGGILRLKCGYIVYFHEIPSTSNQARASQFDISSKVLFFDRRGLHSGSPGPAVLQRHPPVSISNSEAPVKILPARFLRFCPRRNLSRDPHFCYRPR